MHPPTQRLLVLVPPVDNDEAQQRRRGQRWSGRGYLTDSSILETRTNWRWSRRRRTPPLRVCMRVHIYACMHLDEDEDAALRKRD